MAELATRDRDEALDIVQDAMVKLVQRYADRPETEWRALFHRILHNAIQDWHRRHWVRSRWRIWFNHDTRESPHGDPLEKVPDSRNADLEKHLYLKRAAEAVEEALKALPLRQRQAFLFRAWEGLDVAKTAAAMGCSEGSVKTHYSRAVHALRALLESYRP